MASMYLTSFAPLQKIVKSLSDLVGRKVHFGDGCVGELILDTPNENGMVPVRVVAYRANMIGVNIGDVVLLSAAQILVINKSYDDK